VLFNRYSLHDPYQKLARESKILADSLWLSKIVYKAYIDEKNDAPMDKFTPKESLFANLTVLFYFFVALMMWVAIAVIP